MFCCCCFFPVSRSSRHGNSQDSDAKSLQIVSSDLFSKCLTIKQFTRNACQLPRQQDPCFVLLFRFNKEISGGLNFSWCNMFLALFLEVDDDCCCSFFFKKKKHFSSGYIKNEECTRARKRKIYVHT